MNAWRPWRWLLMLVVGAPALPARADDYRPLFNGKDLDGWTIDGPREAKKKDGPKRPVWQVQDGVIVASGDAFGFLRYNVQEFSDFSLRVEYRMEPPAGPKAERANSGIGIRTGVFDLRKSIDTRPSIAAYEIQVQDDSDKPVDEHSTGSLYRYVAAKKHAHKPAPAWNVAEVTCVGPRIRVAFNGEEVLDVDQTDHVAIKHKPLKGYVCVQSHSLRVEFRSIGIREIKSTPSSSAP